MRVFAGPALDRFGRTGLLLGGIAIMACSIFAYAVFPVVGIIMGLRLIQGIGWGSGSTASSTIAADIIPKHRFAEGMGYFAMTNALSSAIAPAVSIELAQGVGGVYMVYVSAGVTCLAFVLAIVEVALGKRKGKGASEPPASVKADLGQEARRVASLSSGHAAEQGRKGSFEAGASARPAATVSGFDKFFERRAIVPGLLMLLVNVGFGCITTFLALHAIERGVDNVTPYFVVYAIVTLISRPFIGKLVDRYGYRMPAILSTLCTAGTLVLIGASNSIAMFALAGVFAGLGVGTAMSTFQAMAVAGVEPWRRGVATSTFMTAFDLGIGIGQFSGGLVAGALGYRVMFYAVALFPVIACIVSLAAVRGRL